MNAFLSCINAFWVGGMFCLIAQLLIDKTKMTPARIMTGYVCLGVLLSAIGIYRPLKEFAGAGASVPLTGFGHLLAEGVRNAVDENGWIGIFSGGLGAASVGVTACLGFGLLWSLVFRSKLK